MTRCPVQMSGFLLARLAEHGHGLHTGGKGIGSSKKKSAGPLFQVRWWRVVLDEAQSIKNPRTLAAHAAWSLKVSCPVGCVKCSGDAIEGSHWQL